jgi:hypothetical protein
MRKSTQFWLALILLGVLILAVLFGPGTAVIGVMLWSSMTAAGVWAVRAATGWKESL